MTSQRAILKSVRHFCDIELSNLKYMFEGYLVSYCFFRKIWWPLLGLNQRPSDYESPALTTELRGQRSGDYNVSV